MPRNPTGPAEKGETMTDRRYAAEELQAKAATYGRQDYTSETAAMLRQAAAQARVLERLQTLTSAGGAAEWLTGQLRQLEHEEGLS